MQNPVADIITLLLQQGKQQGLPMRPSGSLQRQLANMKTSTPDIASVMAPNVEILPGPDMRQFGTPMPKDIWLEMLGQDTPFNTPLSRSDPTYHPSYGDVVPESPTPISQDPYFGEPLPRFDDPSMQPIRPLDMIDPSTTARAHSDSMTSGPLHIWATSKNGKAVRLDGPYQSQSEALRALAEIEKEMKATNTTVPSHMSLFIGPDKT